METAACCVCGKPISGSEVQYTEDAQLICNGCAAKREIVRDEGRAAGNLTKAGWTALGSGVAAFFGPMMLLGIITYFFVATALVSAIYAIQGLSSGNERFTRYLSAGQRTTTWITSILGIVLSALAVLGASGVFALYAMRHAG